MFDHAVGVSKLLNINPSATNLESLDSLVSRGLESSCLNSLAESLFSEKVEMLQFKAKIAPENSSLGSVEFLSVSASQRMERLARTFALANFVFDDLNDARTFFTNQHRALNGQTPLDTSMTELGAIRVSQLLYQLYFGALPHIPK